MSLVVVMGLPAAGKTSLCEKILEVHQNAVLFSMDALNGRWSEDFKSHANRKLFENTVRQFLQEQCDDEFDKIVIVDDNFYLRSMRRPFERMARSFGLFYCCVLVEVDSEEAMRRNALRGEDRVQDETILRMSREIELPEGALVYKGGAVEEILQKLNGPRPKRLQTTEIRIIQHGPFSFLAEMDNLLRESVSGAVHQGLDGRRLASAKKIVLARCRHSKRVLSRNEARDELLKEYRRLEDSGG